MQHMLESLPSDKAIIAMLRFGYFKGRCYSIEALANFLGESEESIKEAIRDSLDAYKDFAMSIIDSAISYNGLPSKTSEGEQKKALLQ